MCRVRPSGAETRITLQTCQRPPACPPACPIPAHIRMYERNILADEVKKVLMSGEIIENYPEDRPLPSCLVLGYASNQRPIHTVVAVDEREPMLWVITVYIPSVDEWDEGFNRRKAQ